jgi:hypothetical protein
VKTYPLFHNRISGILLLKMFLRSTNRKKDGKDHRYFSVVENRRLPGGKTAQRTVLYLGELNDQQQAAWRKTLEAFDEAEQCYTTMSLFPDDREIPADALDGAQIKLSGLELRRPRVFGNRWLACELWQQLGVPSQSPLAYRRAWGWMCSGRSAGRRAARRLVGRRYCGFSW